MAFSARLQLTETAARTIPGVFCADIHSQLCCLFTCLLVCLFALFLNVFLLKNASKVYKYKIQLMFVQIAFAILAFITVLFAAETASTPSQHTPPMCRPPAVPQIRRLYLCCAVLDLFDFACLSANTYGVLRTSYHRPP
jgi:hypothetical protein